MQGDCNAIVGKDACGNWQGICGPLCNDNKNERGLRLLELVTFNDPEDWPGIAKMDNTTTGLITFLRESATDQEWTVQEHEVFQ